MSAAEDGQGGAWLIDPDEINIVADVTTPPPLASPFTSAGDTNIEVQEIGQALAGGDVVIMTGNVNGSGSGDINWTAALDLEDYGSFTSPIGSLTLDAHNDINFTAGIDGDLFSSNQRLQNLTLVAGGDVIFDGSTSEIDIDVNEDIDITATNLRLRDFNLIGPGNDVEVNARDQLLLTISDSIVLESTLPNRVRLNGNSANSIVLTDNLVLRGSSELNVDEGSIVTVTDTLTMDGGNLDVDGETTVNNLVFQSGIIEGYTADDSDVFQTTGEVVFNTAADKFIRQNWNILPTSLVNWEDGDIILWADINNEGTFFALGDDRMTTVSDGEGFIIPPGDFNNLSGGTFAKTGTAGGSTVFLGVDFNNAGDLVTEAGDIQFAELDYYDFSTQSTVTGGRMVQTGGGTYLDGGTLSGREAEFVLDPDLSRFVFRVTETPTTLRFTGGSLNGGISDTVSTGGSIDANLDLQDTEINPGQSPGTLTVNGNLVATDGTVYNVELAGAAPGQYDLIRVNGAATLTNPTVNLIFDGYTPPPDGSALDSFDIFIADTLLLSGATISQPLLPDGTVAGSGQFGGIYRVDYTGGDGGTPPGTGISGTRPVPVPLGFGPDPERPPLLFIPLDPDTLEPGQPIPVEITRFRPPDTSPLLVRLFDQIPPGQCG